MSKPDEESAEPSAPDGDRSASEADDSVRAGKSLREQRDSFREQRDTLREQRDIFREQRDSFREQRDTLREQRDRLRAHRTEMRTAPLFFLNLQELLDSPCPACATDARFVSTYPNAQSASFGSVVVLWCQRCGMGWVPDLPLDLADYYQREYAVENRGDRDMEPEAYFAEDSPFRESRYFRRARFQLERASQHVDSIGAMLDFGSGPGYALFLSGASTKHAVEYDESSKKYLGFIGAERVWPQSLRDGFYDLILSSHSLEHLEAKDLYPTLERFRRSLAPGGILYVEVPGGGLTAYQSHVRHEPHTLFFSPEALVRVLERAGFEVVARSAEAQTENPPLDEPLYSPSEAVPFFAESKDRLTVICRASPNAPAPVAIRALVGSHLGTAASPDSAGD